MKLLTSNFASIDIMVNFQTLNTSFMKHPSLYFDTQGNDSMDVAVTIEKQ